MTEQLNQTPPVEGDDIELKFTQAGADAAPQTAAQARAAVLDLMRQVGGDELAEDLQATRLPQRA